MSRRLLVAVIGDARIPEDDPRYHLAFAVGRCAVDRRARVVTGGIGGVMAAAHAGAHASSCYTEGDTIALLPGFDPGQANPWADIVVPTGLGLARNVLVASADAVIAIGGGAGTLSEIALAWQLRRPVIALGTDGWAGRLANEPLDARDRGHGVTPDRVHQASTPEEAVEMALRLAPMHGRIRSV